MNTLEYIVFLQEWLPYIPIRKVVQTKDHRSSTVVIGGVGDFGREYF
jgi:hypothetical protein